MPKIISSLHELRYSGRMCVDGWATLLAGVGKTKADHEPLDYLTGLSFCGLYDTLWQLPTKPEHSDACRRLALSYALPVAHLSNDPCAGEVLDRLDAYLRGERSAQDVQAAVSPDLYHLLWFVPKAEDDLFQIYDVWPAAGFVDTKLRCFQ